MKLRPALSRLRIPFLAAASALFPLAGHAALVWNTQRIELTTKPTDKEVVGVFRFENDGPAPVTITGIQPSCGCTTAELEKRTYAPGESGEIKAVFTLGGRVGEQVKTIDVATDDPAARPVSLVLHVFIPELLTCSSRLLIWKIGAAPAEKSTVLAANTALKITALELSRESLPKEVTARLELVEAGAKYRLTVAPVSTSADLNVTLAGTATFSDGTVQPFNIFALVR